LAICAGAASGRSLANPGRIRDKGSMTDAPQTSPDPLDDPAVNLPPPAAREAALMARLAELGLTIRTAAHDPVFTVEEARSLRGELPGGHSKNLFLKDKKGGLWLVVAREDLAVDLKALSKQLGSPRFSFGSAALLIETLGIPPGSVTPFSVINDRDCVVQVVLDAGLMALDPLHFHPLRNDRTSAISAADLAAFLEGCGHSPMVAALPERSV
jgi:Ala-tRNA(Pro) deacylase